MPNFIAQQMLDDANVVFTDTDTFGETIRYIPSQASISEGRTARTINAVVIRDLPQAQLGTPNDVRPKMVIHVSNDPVNGISSSEVDLGGDKVEVAYRIGTPVQQYNFALSTGETHDAGMLTLEVH